MLLAIPGIDIPNFSQTQYQCSHHHIPQTATRTLEHRAHVTDRGRVKDRQAPTEKQTLSQLHPAPPWQRINDGTGTEGRSSPACTGHPHFQFPGPGEKTRWPLRSPQIGRELGVLLDPQLL